MGLRELFQVSLEHEGVVKLNKELPVFFVLEVEVAQFYPSAVRSSSRTWLFWMEFLCFARGVVNIVKGSWNWLDEVVEDGFADLVHNRFDSLVNLLNLILYQVLVVLSNKLVVFSY